jgi:hypothetical protein
MTDPNEISALKASFRGALHTADALHALQDRVEALDVHSDVTAADLEELSRITAAHALASAALRGLVNTMIARRAVA